MPESKQPHRRRRPQGLAPDTGEQEILSGEPHRIVVADDDEPEWLVSSARVTGAAERRGQAAPAAKAPAQSAGRTLSRSTQEKRTQESMAILSLKKQGKES
ncbi:MAG: hypothetical protein IJ337_00500, partial [Clostridia bacterium]|nr:hypothetical protein [Clostridia bacterium]